MSSDSANAGSPQATTDRPEERQTIKRFEPEALNIRPFIDCPACLEKRQHTEVEWKLHPGEGKTGRNRDEER